PFLTINRKDIVAFACNDDVEKSQLMQPCSKCLRDIGRVHGQWQLRDIYPFTKKSSFELCQHADEYIGFGRMIPTLFWTKQHMHREGYVMDGEHNTESVLPANDLMIATTILGCPNQLFVIDQFLDFKSSWPSCRCWVAPYF